jgi:hypothetical protein
MLFDSDPNFSSPRISDSTQRECVAPLSPFHSGMPLTHAPGRTLMCITAFAASAVLPRGAAAQHSAVARSGITTHARDAASTRVTRDARAWEQRGEPRSRSGRVALQFLAASAAAAGGGLGTYLVTRDLGETRVKGDEGYTRAGNVGYLVGSLAGSTLGAHLVGTNMGGKAPLWATALGALAGTTPLIALGIDEPYLPLFGVALGWLPQAALATGGFVMAEPR